MTRKTTPTESDVGSNELVDPTKVLEQLTKIIGPAPKLTVNDRKRSQKLRKGGEAVIPTVAALSEKFGLTVASHPTTTMMEKAKKAESLIPLYRDLLTATQRVADQIFAANSESWAAATVHYTMLKRLAKTDGELQKSLAPVEQFFAKRSPAVLAERRAKRAAAKANKAAQAPKPAADVAPKADPIGSTPGAPAPVPAQPE